MALIEQLNPGPREPGALDRRSPASIAVPEVDERAARRTLRDQIGRLERELASACLDACPRIDPGPPPHALAAGPRLLSLGELERVRDALADRLARVRDDVDAQLLRQAEAHTLLERMVADPPAYKWVRVSNAQLGEPGCKHFHVRPRLGPIGLLAGWWHVKVSSGCPLAWGP
jgi:hypothetical protein